MAALLSSDRLTGYRMEMQLDIRSFVPILFLVSIEADSDLKTGDFIQGEDYVR